MFNRFGSQIQQTEDEFILSIIVVTFNCEDSILCTINSLKILCKDVEIIFIDSASTDNTFNLILYSFGLSSNATCISEPDNGIYDAMNKGLIRAKGHWIYFLNSGDSLANDFTLIVKSLSKSSLHDIHVYGVMIDGLHLVRANIPHSKLFFLCNTICHQGAIVKRSLYKRLGGFDLRYDFLADQLFFCNAFMTNAKFQTNNEIICSWPSLGYCKNNLERFNSERRVFERSNFSIFELFQSHSLRVAKKLKRLFLK